MFIEITNDNNRQIEIAKAIVKEKEKYYIETVLESIRNVVREKTSFVKLEDIENEMYKTIYYYWAYGCPADEYYYLNFADKSHEEIKKYVTKREKVIYRNRLNHLEDAHILNNKWDTYNFFHEYYGREVILIKDSNDYPAFNGFIKKHAEFVVKPTDMGGGVGVHKLVTNPLMSEEEKRTLFYNLLDESRRNKILYNRGQEDSVLLEELIKQVPEMAAVHPNSVNAVRVTTVRVGDKVNIFYPWFKFGRSGNFLTSAVFGTLDAIIDVETGVIVTPGFSENNERFVFHPDTGFKIVGFQIPKWKELMDTVTELALKLENIRYVGWDMVLTEKGWILMEGNFSGDFAWQFCLNRGTKKEFEKMIDWKLTKDFWWQE